MLLSNLSLILEGGGMRGMFSAGVFDAFLEKELVFPHIAGVSAGACNILSYMSGQRGRTRRIIEDYVGDDRYCSVKNWLRTRSLFGFDFILNDIPRHLIPFDYDAFYKYPGRLEGWRLAQRTAARANRYGIRRWIWAGILRRYALRHRCRFWRPLCISINAAFWTAR